MKKKPVENENGLLYDDAMFLRVHVGEASETDGDTYQLNVGANGYAPMVTNARTKKTFVFKWEALITLARAAGIDK